MSQGTALQYHELKLLVGDGADPEVFAPICGVTSKDIGITSEVSKTMMPDCADESKPMFATSRVKSQDLSVDVAMTYAMESHGLIWDWSWNGLIKNCKLMFVPEGEVDVGDIEALAGPFLLTNFKMTAPHGEAWTATATLVPARKPTTTLAAA